MVLRFSQFYNSTNHLNFSTNLQQTLNERSPIDLLRKNGLYIRENSLTHLLEEPNAVPFKEHQTELTLIKALFL
jgi:hypothetical protein